MPILRQQVKGKLMGSIGKTKKGGFIANLLVGATTDSPEVLKVHSNNPDDFQPDPTGHVSLAIDLQDFCFVSK